MVVNEATRVKRWRPKTRSGCRTCRLRRIKCDEGRPTCRKCATGNRTCSGYDVPAPASTGHQVALLPKDEAKQAPRDSMSPGSGLDIFPIKLATSEMRALECFKCKVLHLLSIHFTGSVWKDIVLKRSQSDATILHGVLAVGAMFQVRHGQAVGSDRSNSLAIVQTDNRKVALYHYSKALSSLRSSIDTVALSGRETIVQTTLAMCLLFVCFELIQGDQVQAVTHVMKGLQILTEHAEASDAVVSSPPSQNKAQVTSQPLSPGLDLISKVLLRMDREYAIATPHQPYTQKSHNPTAAHAEMAIPLLFESISQAKSCLDWLTSEVLKFRNDLLDLSKLVYFTPQEDYGSDLREFCILNTRARRIPRYRTVQLDRRRDELLAAYDDWLSALSSLWVGMLAPTAALMEMQSFFPWIVLTTSQYDSESLCDTHMDKFNRVLDLATQFDTGLRPKAGDYGFALDTGYLMSLCFVGLKCRDPAMRTRTVRLLKASKLQEGFWGGPLLAEFVEKVVAMEEEQAKASTGTPYLLKAADIPDCARYSDVAFEGVSDSRRLVCTRFVEDDSDEVEVFEVEFPWTQRA